MNMKVDLASFIYLQFMFSPLLETRKEKQPAIPSLRRRKAEATVTESTKQNASPHCTQDKTLPRTEMLERRDSFLGTAALENWACLHDA